MSNGLDLLTRWVLRHKRVVASAWIVLTIAGMFGAARVTDALEGDFSMPASDSFATNARIVERFGSAARRRRWSP